LDLAILGLLAERSHSGYDLKTRGFAGGLSAFWTADQAQIYRTLERLKAEKLVSATRRRQTSRPDRRVFEITHAGQESLVGRLADPAVLPPLRDPFLVQLHFSADLDDDALLGVLETRRDAHQERLDDLRERSAELAGKHHTLPPRTVVMRQTALDGAIVQQRAAIDWLDECIDAVRDGALPGSSKGVGQRHLFGT
jgi:DNA-binding PadR family transcriptional regulator